MSKLIINNPENMKAEAYENEIRLDFGDYTFAFSGEDELVLQEAGNPKYRLVLPKNTPQSLLSIGTRIGMIRDWIDSARNRQDERFDAAFHAEYDNIPEQEQPVQKTEYEPTDTVEVASLEFID